MCRAGLRFGRSGLGSAVGSDPMLREAAITSAAKPRSQAPSPPLPTSDVASAQIEQPPASKRGEAASYRTPMSDRAVDRTAA